MAFPPNKKSLISTQAQTVRLDNHQELAGIHGVVVRKGDCSLECVQDKHFQDTTIGLAVQHQVLSRMDYLATAQHMIAGNEVVQGPWDIDLSLAGELEGIAAAVVDENTGLTVGRIATEKYTGSDPVVGKSMIAAGLLAGTGCDFDCRIANHVHEMTLSLALSIDAGWNQTGTAVATDGLGGDDVDDGHGAVVGGVIGWMTSVMSVHGIDGHVADFQDCTSPEALVQNSLWTDPWNCTRSFAVDSVQCQSECKAINDSSPTP